MQRGRSNNRRLDYWVGIPLLYIVVAFFRRRKPPAEIRKIGVLCSAALGDTLLFSGPLQDLREAYPDAHITHLCTTHNLAAAEIIPGSDERLLISLTKPWKSIPLIRAQKFDLLMDFTTWPRLTAMYTRLSGAKYTVGFRTPGQHRAKGYDQTFEHRADCHEILNLRELVKFSGWAGTPHAPAVVVPDVAKLPFADESDVVVLHLWASGQRSWLREWLQERWVQLARRIAVEKTLFVVTGAPSDATRSGPFVERMRLAGLRAEAFVSPDGLVTLTHVLRRARAVVSVNTGVMHLAAIAGAPTVSLNGPTAEHRWGARGWCCANVQPADGSGGYLHLGFEFKGAPEDVINRIEVEQVVSACETVAQCAHSAVRSR